MSKKLSTGLKSLGIIILAIVLIFVFGFGSITKFVFKKFLFTPYNIVGIIMTIFTICGGYITKRQGHWLKVVLTLLTACASIFSFACTICSWFNIDLIKIIWFQGLKPAVVTVGTVLLWIFLIIISVAIVGFIIYGIVKLIIYIKEEKEWKESLKIYNSQRVLVTKIIKNNSPNVLKQGIKEGNDTRQTSTNTKTLQVQVKLTEQKNTNPQIVVPNNYELQISNNICPECGWYLTKRINGQTGEKFRGCSNFAYHDCKFTISNDEYIRIYKKFH